MADVRKSRRRDKAPIDSRYAEDAEFTEPLLDEELSLEEVENFDLDEGLPPEDVFDTEGRGLPTQYPDDQLDILSAGPLDREPRAGSIRDRLRRASQGSALEGADKTTGYTPSEGETFTFDNTGQMVVPEGESVEKFAPGVRKALDKLNRRGPSPKGGARPSPTPRTRPGPTASPRPVVSPKFSATKPPSAKAAGPLPGAVDPRYREESGPLDDLLGRPMEQEAPADELGGQAALRTGDIGKDQAIGGGGKTAESGWFSPPPGSGYDQLSEEGTLPQDRSRTSTEARTRTDLDPRYKSAFDTTLDTLREARQTGVGELQGAIGRQFGQDDGAEKVAAGRQGGLDRYLEGMDRQDRKQFIDTIAGNLGKVLSGGIGLGAIPTPGVNAAGPLNVAKYYDYKPYDAVAGRAAEKGRFDATMHLQKEMESAQKQGRDDELKAYQTLAEYRSNMTDKELGRMLDMLQLTKQATQLGYNIQTNSIFNEKLMQDLMKMDHDDRMKYTELAVDILTKMIGANAAGNYRSAQGERPGYVEVKPPNQRRLDDMLGMVDSVVASSFRGSNLTPQQMTDSINRQLQGKAEKNYLTGNVEIDAMSTRLLREIQDHLNSLPPNAVVRDPAAYLRSWVKDPQVLLRLGVLSGEETQYEGGKPVTKRPITQVPPGTNIPIRGSDVAGPTPRRQAPAPAPTQAPAKKGSIYRSNGQLMSRKTGQPITNRQELEQLVAEDAKRGLKYPPEILNSVK